MSHPSWVCGLKQIELIETKEKLKVTPFVGVWIETRTSRKKSLKSSVTPFVGVWIETTAKRLKIDNTPVTPFVGVWIETRQEEDELLSTYSHTLRGCVD